MSPQVPPLPHEGPSVPWVSAGAAVCSSFGKARGGGQEAAEKCPAKGRRPGRPPGRPPARPWLGVSPEASQPGVLCRPPGPRPDWRLESDERWGGEGSLLPGHGAACKPQPGASPGPPWPLARPRADRQEWLLKAWAGNLPPSGAWAPERTAEIPAHPQLPSMVRCGNRGPHCGSEASVGPMAPAHKGSPSWGPEASCPGAASTSGLTSHVLSLTLGAWGVGQTPPLSVKPSEHHRARLWGHPSGSNPSATPPGVSQ